MVSEEYGARKPDPAIFRYALKLLGKEAESTLFIGDNAEEDIVGAAVVNMQTAWIRLGREWETNFVFPDHIVDKVWEVEQIVHRSNKRNQACSPR